MPPKQFERHFAGPHNAVLRDLIRQRVKEVDEGTSSYESRHAAIMALRHRIAFTAIGLATLEAVANDYDPPSDSPL